MDGICWLAALLRDMEMFLFHESDLILVSIPVKIRALYIIWI